MNLIYEAMGQGRVAGGYREENGSRRTEDGIKQIKNGKTISGNNGMHSFFGEKNEKKKEVVLRDSESLLDTVGKIRSRVHDALDQGGVR